MRKIRHWGGYGTVMAGKVKDDSCTLHIRVEGNHELGLTRPSYDPETIYDWLVHRFDKNAPGRYDRYTMELVYVEGCERKDGHYVEVCDFRFTY